MPKNRVYKTTCQVCPEYGTIEPTFRIGSGLTSGHLKYLNALKGKKVRVTIEVMEDHQESTENADSR